MRNLFSNRHSFSYLAKPSGVLNPTPSAFQQPGTRIVWSKRLVRLNHFSDRPTSSGSILNSHWPDKSRVNRSLSFGPGDVGADAAINGIMTARSGAIRCNLSFTLILRAPNQHWIYSLKRPGVGYPLFLGQYLNQKSQIIFAFAIHSHSCPARQIQTRNFCNIVESPSPSRRVNFIRCIQITRYVGDLRF